MRFMHIRQTVGETSSSSMASTEQEEEQQPRVCIGALNIFKDPNHELKEKRSKGKYCDVCIPNGCFCPDTWSNEAQGSEKEEKEQPQQVSN